MNFEGTRHSLLGMIIARDCCLANIHSPPPPSPSPSRGAVFPCPSDFGLAPVTCFSQCTVSRYEASKGFKCDCTIQPDFCSLVIYHKPRMPQEVAVRGEWGDTGAGLDPTSECIQTQLKSTERATHPWAGNKCSKPLSCGVFKTFVTQHYCTKS